MVKHEGNRFELPDDDRQVYRIFRKERLLELLRSSELVFVNPSEWHDPFENFLLRCNVRLADGAVASLDDLAAKWYGQCWTFNHESDAMWRIYSQDKDGIRVRSSVGKIWSAIYDQADELAALKYFAGAVQYISRAEIETFLDSTSFADIAFGGQTSALARLLCVKRPEFEHEAEMRVLFFDADGSNRGDAVCRFTIDVGKLIDQVTIDPRLSHDEFQKLREELVRAGCPAPIDQSDLYQVGARTIPAE